MSFPTIAFNSSGSDTTASGDNTAVNVNGSLAQTLSSTTVNITDAAVSLTGVPVDGSACLWVATSSGRRWSKITNITGSVGAYVLTVGDAYGVSAVGQSWAIGGKRATLASAIQLGLDVRAGWAIDVQTNQTLMANFRVTPNSVNGLTFTLTSTVGSRATQINTSTNSVCGLDVSSANNLQITNLYFKSTAGTPGDGITQQTANNQGKNITIDNCVIDGFAIGIRDQDTGGFVTIQGLIVSRTEVKNCTSNPINQNANNPIAITGCYIHNNTGGVSLKNATAKNTVFDHNHTTGGGGNVVVVMLSNNTIVFDHCDFTNAQADSGLYLQDSGDAVLEVTNCIFYGNIGYGINMEAGAVAGLVNSNNAYGGNGTAARNRFPAGTNDVTLTANPFVSSTDFALNSTAGGGPVCKAAGASQALFTATATAPDIGAVQGGSSGGGGGLLVHPGMTGGIHG